MSRRIKNLIAFLLLAALLCTIHLTIHSTENGLSTGNEQTMQDGGAAPPEKPDGEQPNDERPDGEQSYNSTDSEQPPEFDSSPTPGQMNPDSNSMQTMDPSTDPDISVSCYILLIAQNIGVSAILLYLLMSRFHKKDFKKTFICKDKVIIFLLSSIILVAILTFSERHLVQNSFSNSPSTPMEQGNTGENVTDISYSGVFEITEDSEITDEQYASTNADENAVLANGSINAAIENTSIEKTGDSDGGDDTSFYGINSAILAKSGANLTLKNLTITTDAVGANGVFSYGGSATTSNTSSDGTTITISDSTITTKKDNSGGIMTTGGGITNANHLSVHTSGISSAAIRTDRGGGTVNVDGGTYTTTGSGSPSVYSTAQINIQNAALTSECAEGIVIEGKNSVTIDQCDLTDTNTQLNGLSTTYKNIFLYQSMSGDADTGISSFTATDSSITTNNGDTFYITNADSTITLQNNTIVNNDRSGNFLRAQADSWGTEGSNGGNVTLIMNNQKAIGTIVIDKISTLNMTLDQASYYEGTINGENTAKTLQLTLDNTSQIKLTGDSYITSLDNAVSDNSNIDFNGYQLYVNGKAIAH